jgi:hypothetical protein
MPAYSAISAINIDDGASPWVQESKILTADSQYATVLLGDSDLTVSNPIVLYNFGISANPYSSPGSLAVLGDGVFQAGTPSPSINITASYMLGTTDGSSFTPYTGTFDSNFSLNTTPAGIPTVCGIAMTDWDWTPYGGSPTAYPPNMSLFKDPAFSVSIILQVNTPGDYEISFDWASIFLDFVNTPLINYNQQEQLLQAGSKILVPLI